MNRQTSIFSNRNVRAAFTLVEMLVAVTLVLLMMGMFAQIFSIATSSVSKQRVISENDQKARSISTIIRGDLAKRTYTYPLAFYPGEDSATSPTPFGSRAGYIYLNTNDPASFSDDFLQITVNSLLETENRDTAAYYGAAVPLTDRLAPAAHNQSLPANPNQPEVDGGSLAADFSSSSPAAQIAYFIRNGNLYRRIELIRNPIDIAGLELDSQPTSSIGNNFFAGVGGDGFFQGSSGTLSNDFHTFFDFSATASAPGSPNQFAQFIGMEALSNELTSAGAATEAFGNPLFRFGFNQVTGLSREFDNTADRLFIGRYTHAETSTPCFNWPQRPATVELSFTSQTAPDSATILGTSGDGNPNDMLGCPVSLDLNTGLVRQFNGKDDVNDPTTFEGRGGPRQMEDLLLANVQEMRLEIWDDRMKRFVVPGYGSVTDADLDGNGNPQIGDYHIRRNLQFDSANIRFWNGPLAPYSPTAARESDRQPHIFDTWHPVLGADTTGDGIPDGLDFDGLAGIDLHEALPPYLPLRFSPPRRPSGPSSTIMPNDTQLNSVGAPANKGYWAASAVYEVGDVVFTPWSDVSGDGVFSFNEISEPKFAVAYRCISGGTSGTNKPSLATPRQRISDGTVVWESFDNRVPLKTMRMTLRFVNSSNGDPRHLTLMLPLGN